ncbi:hypothetical protein Dimus_031039 [Dionaea muscipula]
MALRSGERKLSFEILSSVDTFVDGGGDVVTFGRSNSDPVHGNGVLLSDERSSRRKRKHRKKKPHPSSSSVNLIAEEGQFSLENTSLDDKVRELETRSKNFVAQGSGSIVFDVVGAGDDSGNGVWQTPHGELRQRSVNNGGAGDVAEELTMEAAVVGVEESVKEEVNLAPKQRNERPNRKLETAESLDWKRLMAEDPNYPLLVENSPIKYFMEEMHRGNSLRSTTTVGNEKERERVYDTIFHLPWRCELLIDVGFFVCMNSFLSLLTIMPVRALMTLWRLLFMRQFKKPSTAELSDFSCLIVLTCGVLLLGQTDISLIYHMIRGQGTIKLYVVYNVLEEFFCLTSVATFSSLLILVDLCSHMEYGLLLQQSWLSSLSQTITSGFASIFDKLWQNFGGDVLETLFNSAEGLVNCSHESLRYSVWRYSADLVLAAAASNILQCFCSRYILSKIEDNLFSALFGFLD